MSDVGLFGSALGDIVTSGIPNASVFPEPVGALQQTSLPSRAPGIVFVWTSKGSSIPPSRRTSAKVGSTPKSVNRTKISLSRSAPTCPI